jgi:hypothetical protein
MRRGILVLSGLVVILSAAALVRGAVGYPLMPWPVSLVILAIAIGTFVITMLQGGEEAEETQKRPARPRALKQHRPRGRAKKRVVRNAMKRRRFRKLKPILLSHDDNVIHPGGQQVGFFG